MQLEFMVLPDNLLAPADGSVTWTAERIGLVFHGRAFVTDFTLTGTYPSQKC